MMKRVAENIEKELKGECDGVESNRERHLHTKRKREREREA